MLRRPLRVLMVAASVLSTHRSPTGIASSGSPGDQTIVITINDSHAGGSYDQAFELAYDNTTQTGTPVYIYVPEGRHRRPDGRQRHPQFPRELIRAPRTPRTENTITQEQIDALGDELTEPDRRGRRGALRRDRRADPRPTNSDALVVLAYNVHDDVYYDCAETTYTAGYFARSTSTTPA